jgi:Flp pilus assembly protein TadD
LGYLNYRRAREELAKAQRELPNNAEVFRMFGQMNRWEGHWEEARQNLRRAVELDPRNARTITDLAWVYMALREYEEADVLATRLQALEPRSPLLRTGRAFIGLEARADMASLRAVLNTIESESPQSATEVADLSFRLALYERDPVEATRALVSMPREGKIDLNGVPFRILGMKGLLAKLRQDAAAAHSAFTAARTDTEKLVRAQPGHEKPLSVLALIDAELGDKEKAIHEGRTACDMLPPTKNALDGIWLMTNLARIYTLTGEKDLALEQLEVLSKLPSAWFGLSYGELRLNPEWDLLRGDPRFEKIVASLAPKNGKAQPRCSTKRSHARRKMKHWELIADNLSKAGWSWGCVSAIDPSGRTFWIADAHRGGSADGSQQSVSGSVIGDSSGADRRLACPIGFSRCCRGSCQLPCNERHWLFFLAPWPKLSVLRQLPDDPGIHALLSISSRGCAVVRSNLRFTN